MQNKKTEDLPMIINYNVAGSERKKLAQTIAEIFESDVKYLGAPSFAYQIDYFTLDRIAQ